MIRNRFVLPFWIMIVLLMVGCSGNDVSGKYVTMGPGGNFYEFRDGKFTTADDTQSGDYAIADGIITLVYSDGETRNFEIQGDYLLVEKYNGAIPKKDFFRAECVFGDNYAAVTFVFDEDGSFAFITTALGNELGTIHGVYERDGDKLKLISDNGDISYKLILDNILYTAYEKE